MKSYTDIKQSEVLAEILPLESADMSWVDYGYCKRVLPKDDVDANAYPIIIPAWSLAALLDVLPKYIGDYGKCLYYDAGYYYCGYMVDGDFMLTIEETKADNPIDACVEMIVTLKEKGLL